MAAATAPGAAASAEEAPRLAAPPAPASSAAPPVPAADTWAPDVPVREPQGRADPDGTPTAAAARLGAEGLSRLRARHAEVLARIAEKVSEPERQDELRAQADRLNPDTWVTDADVTAGLEEYEGVFASLRGVVGHRRKRRRRRAPDAGEGEAGPATGGEPL